MYQTKKTIAYKPLNKADKLDKDMRYRYTLSDFLYPIRFPIPMRFLNTYTISESQAIPYTFRFLNM